MDGREERSGDKVGMEGKQEVQHLLWHHLFDLWFHVAVHCFGFKTDKHTEIERAQHIPHTAIKTSVHHEE